MKPKGVPFIEIRNINATHWIIISAVDVPPSTIRVYDSKHGQLPQEIQKLVKDILQSSTATLSE